MSFSDGTAMTESPWEGDFDTTLKEVYGVSYIPSTTSVPTIKEKNENIIVKIYIKG